MRRKEVDELDKLIVINLYDIVKFTEKRINKTIKEQERLTKQNVNENMLLITLQIELRKELMKLRDDMLLKRI